MKAYEHSDTTRIGPSADQADGPSLHVSACAGSITARLYGTDVLFAASHVEMLGERLARLLADPNTQRLVVDLRNVRYVSGFMLGKLASLHEQATRDGKQIVLRGAGPVLRDMLRITRLDSLFSIEPTAPQQRQESNLGAGGGNRRESSPGCALRHAKYGDGQIPAEPSLSLYETAFP